MEASVELKDIQMMGYVLFVMKTPGDQTIPAVSITMRKDVAKYLKRLVEEDQNANSPKHQSLFEGEDD